MFDIFRHILKIIYRESNDGMKMIFRIILYVREMLCVRMIERNVCNMVLVDGVGEIEEVSYYKIRRNAREKSESSP